MLDLTDWKHRSEIEHIKKSFLVEIYLQIRRIQQNYPKIQVSHHIVKITRNGFVAKALDKREV